MTSAWNTIKFYWNVKFTPAYENHRIYAHFQRWKIFFREHQNLIQKSHTCAIIKRDSRQIFQVTGHLQLLYYSFWHIYYIDHVINHVTHVTRDFILITFTPELTSPWPLRRIQFLMCKDLFYWLQTIMHHSNGTGTTEIAIGLKLGQ